MYVCVCVNRGEVGRIVQVGELGNLSLHGIVVLVDGLQLPVMYVCMYV